MVTRRIFVSFHYKQDNWRAAEVRNKGLIQGNRTVSDNEWETVTRGGSVYRQVKPISEGSNRPLGPGWHTHMSELYSLLESPIICLKAHSPRVPEFLVSIVKWRWLGQRRKPWRMAVALALVSPSK